jgi:regulator of replication initiation timing
MMIDTLTATVSELERKLAQQTSDLSQLQLSLSTVMNEKETLQANLFAVQRFLGADLFKKVLSGTAGVSFDQNNTNQSSDNMTPELVPSSDCSMSSSHGSMTNSESLDVESSASLNGKKTSPDFVVGP